MFNFIKNIFIFCSIILLFSCVSYKPIFDQNQKFLAAGKDTAYEDFEKCKSRADDYLKEYKLKKTRNEITRKAIFGGMIGGLFGLIFGNSAKSFVKGAIGGAVFGGIYGGASSLTEGDLKPDEIKQRYITKCLNQRGYEIIGWY